MCARIWILFPDRTNDPDAGIAGLSLFINKQFVSCDLGGIILGMFTQPGHKSSNNWGRTIQFSSLHRYKQGMIDEQIARVRIQYT
jgi:hypothetical protein